MADQDQWFYFRGGRAARTPKDLISILEEITEDEFQHHVKVDGNDFANWVRDVFDEPALADHLDRLKDRKDILGVLKDYFGSEQRQETVKKNDGPVDASPSITEPSSPNKETGDEFDVVEHDAPSPGGDAEVNTENDLLQEAISDSSRDASQEQTRADENEAAAWLNDPQQVMENDTQASEINKEFTKDVHIDEITTENTVEPMQDAPTLEPDTPPVDGQEVAPMSLLEGQGNSDAPSAQDSEKNDLSDKPLGDSHANDEVANHSIIAKEDSLGGVNAPKPPSGLHRKFSWIDFAAGLLVGLLIGGILVRLIF